MFKILKVFFFLLVLTSSVYSNEIIKKIEVVGNDRIPEETIKLFSGVSVNDFLDSKNMNQILNSIYQSNFFKNVSLKFIDNILTINVEENPIILNININGIKSDSLKSLILQNIKLKSRSSYNESIFKNDLKIIESILREKGYFFSSTDILLTDLANNQINLDLDINLGKKAKIKKISFIGNKIFKDRKLKNVIVSEEYKFWKFISGKKFLNESIINLDNRLLKNFYLNKGFFNVEINSSFAKLINDDEFELIFNINTNEKVYFNDIELLIPDDFDRKNFSTLIGFFNKVAGEPYSLDVIENIIERIENYALLDQYESINVNIEENLVDNKLNITFKIDNSEKLYVSKINILGNNITNESVIRNKFSIDEGDPFNQILFDKSINEIKRLNFFREVKYEIFDNLENKTKDINITVEEKPTGEISLGAGVGTGGSNISFSVKENNFLGNGVALDTSLNLGEDTINGLLQVKNPNYKNSDKSVYYNIQAIEVDKLSTYGYKSNKAGFTTGTNFEYYQDLFLGIGLENFVEKIDTSPTASSAQKSQEGNYWDVFLNLDFNYDKRNQKYETNSGYYSFFSTKLPLVSESLTFVNEYNFKYFAELYENNITTAAYSLSVANSLNNKNIKLSERLFVPSRKLRGFEAGKVGPKDGNDYVGGNLISALNLVSNLPKVFENTQNLDFSIFFDAVNISGVDYNSSLDINNDIKSSVGLGVDWLTPVGPLSFSFAQPITKSASDITETFRFNLGTSF